MIVPCVASVDGLRRVMTFWPLETPASSARLDPMLPRARAGSPVMVPLVPGRLPPRLLVSTVRLPSVITPLAVGVSVRMPACVVLGEEESKKPVPSA